MGAREADVRVARYQKFTVRRGGREFECVVLVLAAEWRTRELLAAYRALLAFEARAVPYVERILILRAMR